MPLVVQEIKFEPNVMCEPIDKKLTFRASQVNCINGIHCVAVSLVGLLTCFSIAAGRWRYYMLSKSSCYG